MTPEKIVPKGSIHNENKTRMEPWGTPYSKTETEEENPSRQTEKVISFRLDSNQLRAQASPTHLSLRVRVAQHPLNQQSTKYH